MPGVAGVTRPEAGIVSAENVLVAVGRAPSVEGLCLEKAGVQYTNKGIEVNPYLQTTNRGIFACGDCISKSLRQVVNACGDGAMAAHSVSLYVDELKGQAY